jgi:2,4-dienoyl-CoA reductase-like NADH-dependent reductase (Old Yellow Enzyme family)
MTDEFVRSATDDNRTERGFATESQTGFCTAPSCKRLTGVVRDYGGRVAVQLCHADSEKRERTKKADEQERECCW